MQFVSRLRVTTVAIRHDGFRDQRMLEAAYGQVRLPPHVLAMAFNALYLAERLMEERGSLVR